MTESKRPLTEELKDKIFQAVLTDQVRDGEFGEYEDVEGIEYFVLTVIQTIAVCE